MGVRPKVRFLPRQTFGANRARPDPAWKNHQVWFARRWWIHGALLRGPLHGSTLSRHAGVFLLDPKAPGALLRRRLRVGDRRSGQGGDMVRDVPRAVALSRGEGGMSPLCRAVARRTVRARGSRPVRQASRSTWRA